MKRLKMAESRRASTAVKTSKVSSDSLLDYTISRWICQVTKKKNKYHTKHSVYARSSGPILCTGPRRRPTITFANVALRLEKA